MNTFHLSLVGRFFVFLLPTARCCCSGNHLRMKWKLKKYAMNFIFQPYNQHQQIANFLSNSLVYKKMYAFILENQIILGQTTACLTSAPTIHGNTILCHVQRVTVHFFNGQGGHANFHIISILQLEQSNLFQKSISQIGSLLIIFK